MKIWNLKKKLEKLFAQQQQKEKKQKNSDFDGTIWYNYYRETIFLEEKKLTFKLAIANCF